MAMIQRFNVVSRWVATEIVRCEDFNVRASVLNHFLEVLNVRRLRLLVRSGTVRQPTDLILMQPAAMYGTEQLQLLHGDHLRPAVLLRVSPQAHMGGSIPLCPLAFTSPDR